MLERFDTFLEEQLIPFVTVQFPHAGECMAFGIAFQGAIAVRNTYNKNGDLHWFHAFVLSLLMSFAGGLTGFAIMGLPSVMLSNDLNLAVCMIAFVLANYTPFDIGYKLGDSLPGTIVTVSFAQLFRCNGTMKFISVAFEKFQHAPTKYYPTPLLGPILYGTLLGSMNGFIMKGIDGFFKDGIPWPFQNGFTAGTFYHLYVHDKKGFLGEILRDVVFWTGIQYKFASLEKLDDQKFAFFCVSLFMQITGILQTKHFWGGKWSPFDRLSMHRSKQETPTKAKRDLSDILEKEGSKGRSTTSDDAAASQATGNKSKKSKSKRKKRFGGGNKEKQT